MKCSKTIHPSFPEFEVTSACVLFCRTNSQKDSDNFSVEQQINELTKRI